MTLSERYRSMIDQVMAEKVEGWQSLSSLDPTKMIVSGLVGSLTQIEERQKRLSRQMLSLTPTYFGLESRAATGPRVLMQIAARGDLHEDLVIEAPYRVRASSPENKDVLFRQNLHVLPIELNHYEFSAGEKGTELKCQIKVKGATHRLELYWLPHKLISLAAGALLRVSLKTANTEWNLGELRVEDNTDGLSGHGSLVVELPTDKSTYIETGTVELNFQWENTVLIPTGSQLLVNAFPAQYVSIREWDSLGTLKGDAWEEVRLAPELLEIPQELILERPEGGRYVSNRLSHEILRTISSEESEEKALRYSFIYNSVRHSLIFPAAHLLVGNTTAGLQITSREVVLQAAACDELVVDPLQVKGEIIQPTAIANLESASLRESEEEVMARFHSSLRAFHLVKGAMTEKRLDLNEIHSAVFSADPRIRSVDLELKKDEKLLTVFVSTEDFLDKEGQLAAPSALAADLREKLRRLLALKLPVEYNFRISTFQRQALRFGLRMTHSPNMELSPELIEAKLNRKLIPLRSSLKHKLAPIAVSALLADLQSEIPNLFKIEGTLMEERSGDYVQSVCRNPGTLYYAKCDLDLKVAKYA